MKRASDKSSFNPVYLNHQDGDNSNGCNCVQTLDKEGTLVAFGGLFHGKTDQGWGGAMI
jgi:hypothetical protein